MANFEEITKEEMTAKQAEEQVLDKEVEAFLNHQKELNNPKDPDLKRRESLEEIFDKIETSKKTGKPRPTGENKAKTTRRKAISFSPGKF